MNDINDDNLEAIGCRTFACANLSLIDEKGKELELSNEIIENAKAMAIEYLKKTYLRPHYSSIIYLLPSFLFIASIKHGNMIKKKRVSDVFGTSSATINKWNKDIIDTLKIEMNEKSENVGDSRDITILSASDVIENKSTREREPYHDFDVAFQHAIPDILDKIKKNGTILVRISNIVEELGDKFKNMSDMNIYMGMRHILFKYDIRVESITFNESMKGLKMRMLEEGDPLPSSIKRMKNKQNKNEDAI